MTGPAGNMRACSHGSGEPRAGEVPHPSGVTNLSIYILSFFLDRVHMLGYPVSLSEVGGPVQPTVKNMALAFCHLNVCEIILNLVLQQSARLIPPNLHNRFKYSMRPNVFPASGVLAGKVSNTLMNHDHITKVLLSTCCSISLLSN